MQACRTAATAGGATWMAGRQRSPPSSADEPLLSAASAGRLAELAAALDAGGDPNAVDYSGDTALLLAARGRHVDCCALLAARGAKGGGQGSRGETAAMVAAQLGCIQLLEAVLTPDVDLSTRNDAGLTAFQLACAGAHPPALLERLLQHHHQQAQLCTYSEPGSQEQPAQEGFKVTSASQLAAGRPLVLAMYVAVAAGDSRCLQLLVRDPLARAAYIAQFGPATAPAEAPPTPAQSHEQQAAQHGQTHAQQAEQQRQQLQQCQQAALARAKDRAADEGLQGELGFLLEARVAGAASPQAVSFLWRSGGLPVHLAAVLNQPDCLHLLLTSGLGGVEDPTADGFTPLMLAAAADALSAAAVLLRHGAALEARNSAGRTALFLAAVGGAPAVLALLIGGGADVNAAEQARGCSPLAAAVSRAAACEASSHPGAATFLRCIQQLLAAGADPGLAAKDGATALHAAAEGGSRACMDLLLQAGALLDARDAAGRTPLALAAGARQPQPHILLHLLAKGAAVGSAELASKVLSCLLLSGTGAAGNPHALHIGSASDSASDSATVVTAWRLLALLNAEQLRELTACPKFYDLPHTGGPEAALPPAAVHAILELVTQSASNLLYNVSAADNVGQGRRPSYLLELLRRAVGRCTAEDGSTIADPAEHHTLLCAAGGARSAAGLAEQHASCWGPPDGSPATRALPTTAGASKTCTRTADLAVDGAGWSADVAAELRPLVAASPDVAKLLTMWTPAQMLLQYASCIVGCAGIPARDREQLALRVGHLLSTYQALAGLCCALGLSLTAGLAHPHDPLDASTAAAAAAAVQGASPSAAAPFAAASAATVHLAMQSVGRSPGGDSWPRQEPAIAAALRPFGEVVDGLVGCIRDQAQLQAWHFVLEYGRVASLATKQRLLQSVAAAWPRKQEEQLALSTGRHQVLQRVCSAVDERRAAGQGGAASAGAALWHGVKVAFEQEHGAGDGPRREWFSLLAAELAHPDTGLFESHNGGSSFSPAPHSNIHSAVCGSGSITSPCSGLEEGPSDHLRVFELVGSLVGLALLQGCTMPGLAFSAATWRLALGQPPQPETDLAEADPVLHHNLQLLRSMGPAVEQLGLHFEVHDSLGRAAELCPGGAGQLVTAGNVEQYISALAQYKQVACMAAQAVALGRGLRGVLTGGVADGLSRWFRHGELNAMLAGLAELDVTEWQAHTRYEHCTERTSQLVWLWRAVGAWGQQQRRQLLAFVTGSASLPAGGFAALRGFNSAPHPFTVCLVAVEGDGRLPRASTCFNTLFLPLYSSPAVLEMRLLQAISGAQVFDEAVIRR